ncbi:MAG: hypothetical protein EOM52_00315 [Clostridia bacterium]|nr:hypothetical protein [Clostridia bacterium]
MRVLILSDLHIAPYSNNDSTPWVSNFCCFIKNGKYYADTLILVLGDIISNDGKSGEMAFGAADKIFTYIESELAAFNYKIAFIPGNHDYCNGTLDAFDQFCRRHQTATSEPLVFSYETTFNYTVGNFNFIFTDSIREKNYGIAGRLDLDSLHACILADKENMLFMHHSLLFEDPSDHTGIIQQPLAMDFLKQHGVKFVFHGHAHAMRDFVINGDCKLFGVGSIGVEDPGTDNEKEQFLEVQINGRSIEAVANWLWRGGSKRYIEYCIFPSSSREYDSGDLIPRKPYENPENYIERYVLPRDIASQDEVTRYFSLDKKTTLFDACMKQCLVLFIADAGLGKTVEMQHLAYSMTTEKTYLRPVFLSLNVYDGESIENYISILAPEYKTLDPDQFVLIMDGYDELSNPETFKKALFKYIAANSKTHICISMRSNFLAVNSSVFKDFFPYQLLELGSIDIERELLRSHIDKRTFYEECLSKNLRMLLPNPFYLSKIIEIYLMERSLPDQSHLIARFMDIQFDKDAEKFEFVGPIAESRYEVERALTRFAYGMQLLNCTNCDEKTYQCIIEDKDDRKNIKHSSLTIITCSGHGFGHNIFKEYLVAKHVSRMSPTNIVEQVSISGTKYLHPNWFNVLGLVLQLNSNKKLESWIMGAEPLVLTRLEPDRVTPELRYSILVATLDNIVMKNIWFRNEICSEEQLAAFTQSPDAVDLLVQHIETPAHFRSLYFCLSVLLNFSNLYGADAKVQQLLVNCYQNDSVRSHEKRVAISAIAALKLNTSEITEDLIHRFAESRSSYERLGVYEYLQQSHLCDANVNFLLQGIKYLSYSSQNDEISNGTEHFTLIDCLNSISDPMAIEKAIRWYSNKDHIDIDFYDREKLFSNFFDKAADAYCHGYHALFETVYVFFINATRQYSRYHIPDTLKFFATTGTIETAFTQLVSEDADDRLFMIEDTMQSQPELIDVFCRLYAEDQLKDQSIFRAYTLRHQRNPALFEKCVDLIRIKTGEVLDPIEPQPDYNLQRRKDVQTFFDCLFDPQSMRILLIQLADFYGNEEITFEQVRELRTWHERYPEGTRTLETALIQSSFKEECVIDFVDLIDWDFFFINRICYLFKNENALTSLDISEKQRNVIEIVYHQLEQEFDYHTAIEEPDPNSYTFSWKLHDYMIIKEAMNLPSPDDYYLGLLEIPAGFVNKQSNVGEKYALIEQHIAPHNIALRIEELTPQETRICVLEDLMFGCNRYQIKSCKDAAIQMCKKDKVSAYSRRNALEYLFNVFGSELILNEIMPATDNALFELIVDMLRENPDSRLKAEMIRRYKIAPDRFLLKNLIALNVPEGLQFYIEKCKEINEIFDCSDGISEVTEAISAIHDIRLLPLLLDAVRMRFSDSFKDGSFHTLYGSLQNALSACAKSDVDLVLKSIDSLKEELSQDREAISFCSVLQDSIIEANKMALVKKWSAYEVRIVLRTID